MDCCGRWHHPAVALLLAMPTFDQHTSHMFQDAKIRSHTQIPFHHGFRVKFYWGKDGKRAHNINVYHIHVPSNKMNVQEMDRRIDQTVLVLINCTGLNK